MPLTTSHPAAAVPFARLGFVLSALVIGSMTPDFPYFVLFLPAYTGFSHSFVGLFGYCLPVGLVSLGVFHFLIKYPALVLLPVNHQARLYGAASNFSFWPLRRFLLIILSLLLGALTHTAWDSCTHEQGWVVAQFEILRSPIFTVGPITVLTYEFLQHGSTFLGAFLLLYWYIKWYKDAKPSEVPANLSIARSTKITLWIIMPVTAFVIAVVSGFVSVPAFHFSLYVSAFVGHVFIVSVSICTLELILFSIYWHLRLKKKSAI